MHHIANALRWFALPLVFAFFFLQTGGDIVDNTKEDPPNVFTTTYKHDDTNVVVKTVVVDATGDNDVVTTTTKTYDNTTKNIVRTEEIENAIQGKTTKNTYIVYDVTDKEHKRIMVGIDDHLLQTSTLTLMDRVTFYFNMAAFTEEKKKEAVNAGKQMTNVLFEACLFVEYKSPDGTEIKRMYPSDKTSSSKMDYEKIEYIDVANNETTKVKYYDSGKVIKEEHFDSGKLIKQLEIDYGKETMTVTRYFPDGIQEITVYDLKSNVITPAKNVTTTSEDKGAGSQSKYDLYSMIPVAVVLLYGFAN